MHKGEHFEGEHEPIVSEVLWDEVQGALTDRAQGHSRRLKAARQLVMANSGQSLGGISSGANRCRTRLAQLVSLSCMVPDIVTAIVEGRQPSTLTARPLLTTELPPAWPDQRATFGFSQAFLTAVSFLGPETAGVCWLANRLEGRVSDCNRANHPVKTARKCATMWHTPARTDSTR